MDFITSRAVIHPTDVAVIQLLSHYYKTRQYIKLKLTDTTVTQYG
jgi:hypothetical protein